MVLHHMTNDYVCRVSWLAMLKSLNIELAYFAADFRLLHMECFCHPAEKCFILRLCADLKQISVG